MICRFCEADGLPGDNDHCVWDGRAHPWHVCGNDLRTDPTDSNCPAIPIY